MKKNKAIVFALLGVLSVSAITAGAFYGTVGTGLHANATITSACPLAWNSMNRPELQAGEGSAISGHTIIEYSGAQDAPIGSHVTLGVGGKIFNNVNTKWNRQTGIGGVINGIERIVVTFKDNSAGKAKLKLEAKHFSHLLFTIPDVSNKIAIDLTGGEGLANNFVLTCEGTEGTIDIQSLEIGCTMSVRNELDVNAPRSLVEAYKVNGEHLGNKITWKSNFGKGDLIALKVKAGHREILDASHVKVTNGSLINKVIDGEDTLCVYANPIEGNNYIKVDVDGYSYPIEHETGNFLGTFKLYDLNADKVVDVTVKNTARVNYNGVETDYTVTFKDASNPDSYQVNFTYNNNPTTITKIDDNLIVADETIGSRHVYHLGYKDTCNLNKIYKSGQSELIAKMDNGTVHHTAIIDNSQLFIDGIDGIKIGGYPQGEIVKDGIIYVDETAPIANKTKLETIYKTDAHEVARDATNKTIRVVMKTVLGPDVIKRDNQVGTYQNDKDTITLDGYGFYQANIAGKASTGKYEYLADTKELTLDGKTTYIIDVAKKTYKAPGPVAEVDPFATVAAKYYNASILYKFFNGTLTIVPITAEAEAKFPTKVVSVPYTYEKGIVKATIPEYRWKEGVYFDETSYEPDYYIDHSGPAQLSFTYIDGSLKPTDKLVAVDGTTKEIVIGKWTTLNQIDDPWAGKTATYKYVNNDITYTVAIADDQATFTTNDPALEGAYTETTAYYIPTSTGFSIMLNHKSEGKHELKFEVTPEGNIKSAANFLNSMGSAVGAPFGSLFVKQA